MPTLTLKADLEWFAYPFLRLIFDLVHEVLDADEALMTDAARQTAQELLDFCETHERILDVED